MSLEEIEKAAKTLADAKQGWVFRRDAAEALGQAACRALNALHAQRKDKDVDVRQAVERALSAASAGLAGIKPRKSAHTLEELARSCEKTGERTVLPHQDGFIVEVKLSNQRHQRIYLAPCQSKDKIKLIRLFTVCGKADSNTLAWALRTNMQITQGALALQKDGDEERLILTNSFLADEATPAEIRAAVKELSFYGDWIEQKLGGKDEL
ncbi:MAG: hypothetical protein HY706_19445 [Candidatus Hydrogenedentes bacterium]|nr:hypothetical protein [Candidatus Hydrogenedentota bacterium]